MNKKSFLVFVSVIILTALDGRAQGTTSRIEIEKGERWWGIFAGGGPIEPFVEPFSADALRPGGSDPVMLASSFGRYIWCPGPARVSFDGTRFTIQAETGGIEAQKGGRNLREAYLVCCHKNCPPDAAASAVDQRMICQPLYETRLAFGADHSAEILTKYAQDLLKAGFPAGILVVADGWQDAGGGMDFDRRYYPDPKGFVDGLHKLGFSVMLTVTPFTAASGRGYNPAALVCDHEGCVKVGQTASGFQACIDVCNDPEGFGESLGALVGDYGVDGFDMDAAGIETFYEQSKLAEFVNVWGSWPSGRNVLCRRSVAASAPYRGTVASIWYDADAPLERTVNDAVSASLTGYPYTCPQWRRPVAPDAAVLARILQMSVMLPVSAVPVNPLEAPFTEVAKNALKTRAAMNKYVTELAADAARTSEPIVRCMEYNFPRSGFSDCSDQYMVGTRYLVAPGDARTVRLPRGIWVDQQGKRHKGPLVIQAKSAAGEPLVYELIK